MSTLAKYFTITSSTSSSGDSPDVVITSKKRKTAVDASRNGKDLSESTCVQVKEKRKGISRTEDDCPTLSVSHISSSQSSACSSQESHSSRSSSQEQKFKDSYTTRTLSEARAKRKRKLAEGHDSKAKSSPRKCAKSINGQVTNVRHSRSSTDEEIKVVHMAKSTMEAEKELIAVRRARLQALSNESDWSNLKSNKPAAALTQAEFFPTVGHVTNLAKTELKKYERFKCELNLLPESSPTKYSEIVTNNTRLGLDMSRPNVKPVPSAKAKKVIKAAELKKLCKELSVQSGGYPVSELHQVMLTQQVSAALNSSGADLWADKYHPETIDQLLIGEGSKEILANWLSKWRERIECSIKTRSNPKKKIKASRVNDDSDSDDGDDVARLSSLLVISGAVGVGKSTSIHTACTELGFKVFEVNPSMVRTSKAILDQLKESTQSQRVLSTSEPSPMSTFFTQIKDKSNKSKGTSQPQSADGESGDSETSRLSKLSLILFDEADIVFESDKGFYETIKSLAEEARKPLAITCQDTNFMSAINTRYTHLELSPHKASDIAAYLCVVCLLENERPDYNSMIDLVRRNNCDIRKCLNLLQFICNGLGLPSEQSSSASSPNAQTKNKRSTEDTFKLLLQSIKSKSFLNMVTSKSQGPSINSCCPSGLAHLPSSIPALADYRTYYTQLHDSLYKPVKHHTASKQYIASAPLPHIQHVRGTLPPNLSSISDSDLATDLIPLLQSVCVSEEERRKANTSRRFLHRLDKMKIYLTEADKDALLTSLPIYIQTQTTDS